MKRIIGVCLSLLVAIAAVAINYQPSTASDHDDGEQDSKSRALNLTDHFTFKSPADPAELSIITYFNSRSLPGKQYFLSPNARYEQHVTKIATKDLPATGIDDFVFRFEAVGAPMANGSQMIKLTVLKSVGGVLTEQGSMMGSSTSFAGSKNNSALITNTGTIGGLDVKWFAGQRADSFHFDVVRFFEVRAFLAGRFFGKGGTKGDAATGLGPNCRGDQFLALVAGNEAGGIADHDVLNLWNPPSCAPDFTKGLNVTAIVLNVKIAQLGGTVFDTWSTISTLQAP